MPNVANTHFYMQRLRRRTQLMAMVSTDIYPLRGYFYKIFIINFLVLTKRSRKLVLVWTSLVREKSVKISVFCVIGAKIIRLRITFCSNRWKSVRANWRTYLGLIRACLVIQNFVNQPFATTQSGKMNYKWKNHAKNLQTDNKSTPKWLCL